MVSISHVHVHEYMFPQSIVRIAIALPNFSGNHLLLFFEEKEAQNDKTIINVQPKANQTTTPKDTEQQKRCTLSVGTMTDQELNNTCIKDYSHADASTQTETCSLDKKTEETIVHNSAPVAHLSQKIHPTRRAKMRLAPYVSKQPLQHGLPPNMARVESLNKMPLPSNVEVFGTEEPSTRGGCSNGVPTCVACGPHVNSRNLLDILMNGSHVCEKHRKLGKHLLAHQRA